MDILMYPILALYAILGGGSSILFTGYMIIIIAQKIKNKILHGASLYA
ncbi:MAG: hypothetical protein U0L05_07930 [Schaedlerella sp.]|nr:hypothetical protein [Schaedlerella sp.]